MNKLKISRSALASLKKCPTGVSGFDEITEGGLPRGRSTLVCGSAGSCKTLLAVEFLVRGAEQYGEPGVLMAFEETPEEISDNVASLGFNLRDLIEQKKLAIDFVQIDRSEIREMGDYNLEGLFVRLGHAIASLGAKRVAIDSLETLFVGLTNVTVLRAELRRLVRWLKDRGVTAIITAERGDGTLTRHGLEEYVCDCVVLLDHRLNTQMATRRLRVIKYRGSRHGTDEYPFMIGDRGLVILPITSVCLSHPILKERVSTGIPRLDTMLAGNGFYRGSSILVTGAAGTGKTSIGAHFMDAACRRGERCLVFLYEESPDQLIRNMNSIGIDLGKWVSKGLLHFRATRPTLYGLELHLESIRKCTSELKPRIVVVDPVTNLINIGTSVEVRSMLTRVIDFLKMNQITAFFTSLAQGSEIEETSGIGISSLMDTWLLVRDVESNGERNRVLYVLKSRGMAHSNQVREFRLTNQGVDLLDVYVGHGGVLTGTARIAQEAREKAEEISRRDEFEQRRNDIVRKRIAITSQIEALRLELGAAEQALVKICDLEDVRKEMKSIDSANMALARYADSTDNLVKVQRKKGV